MNLISSIIFPRRLLAVGLLAAGLGGASLSFAADNLTKVRMTFDDDMVVTRLADRLGYFKQEGIEIVPVDLLTIAKEDYLLQEPLVKGQIDAAEHWFNHTIFGARHCFPIQAVMMFNDAPAMKVLVANRVKDQIRSAADFKGHNVADGAGYATKAVITGYLAKEAGLPRESYHSINHSTENRLNLVLADLRADKLDVMTFQEPIISGLEATGLVSTLYDLMDREGTQQALGTAFPAQSILMAPQFIKDHPDTVQHLVNAYVRAMRYLNSHSADEVIALMPDSFFDAKKDRAAQVRLLQRTIRSYAKGSYAFPADAVHLVTDAMLWAKFDHSEEGIWRATGDAAKVHEAELFTNEFVNRAMQAFPAVKVSAERVNAGVSIWTQNVSGFRKEHGSVGGYTKRWDLSDLPHYLPQQQLTGTIRIWGNNYLKDGPLGDYWVEAFKKFQPGLTLEFHLPTGAIAVSAVAAGVADLGMNYKATLSDRLIFEQVFHHPLTEVMACTGSFDVYGWGPPRIVVVRQDNPLTQISVKQLDGVFGSARLGGYAGSVWHTEYPYARGPEENIRRWGQLGLTGEWAGQPISVGGQNLSAGVMVQFSAEVLMGSLQFVDGYQAYTNYITPDGKINSWSLQVRRAMARDKYGIYYASPSTLSPGMKELAVQAREGGPFVKRTLETTRDNSYPLTHHSFFYFNREPGKPVDPKVEEFLRFVLSQEGQDCVQHEGRYLPLTGAIVREQLRKID